MFIPGQSESPAGEKPVEGDLHPSPEPSPDDLSSPNPYQAAPLLQAQQRPPSRAERDEMRPGSAGGVGKMDAEVIETAAVKERVDIQDFLVVADREISEQERTTEKDSERDRIEEEKDCEDEEAADRETADEGLPLSRGSEDENEEESEGQNVPPDANNNSLETPQDCQDDFIDIPEPPAQVGLLFLEMNGGLNVNGVLTESDETIIAIILHIVGKNSSLCMSLVSSLRLTRWRRHTALTRSRWFWSTTLVPGPRRLTWTTVTQSRSSSP